MSAPTEADWTGLKWPIRFLTGRPKLVWASVQQAEPTELTIFNFQIQAMVVVRGPENQRQVGL